MEWRVQENKPITRLEIKSSKNIRKIIGWNLSQELKFKWHSTIVTTLDEKDQRDIQEGQLWELKINNKSHDVVR